MVEPSKLTHLGHDFPMKMLFSERLFDAGLKLGLGVITGGVPNEDFLFGELIIKKERVVPFKRWHAGSSGFKV
jgi:hypothetical protein